MRKFFNSFRRAAPVTAADIRERLAALRQEHTQTVRQRHELALDALRDGTADARWTALDETARHLTRRIDVLAAALPQAEAKEAEAAQHAEAVRRERVMVAYQQHVQEAQQYIATVLGKLPDGETLTCLRDLGRSLASEARELSSWSNAPLVRRPPDLLSTVADAMQMRLDRIVRARWAPKSAITLRGGATSSELSEATARVEDAS